MLINENTELDGKILCYMNITDDYYKCYTFKLNDIKKVIRYYGDINTYWNCMHMYVCCSGSNIQVRSNSDTRLYTEALIELKNGLCLISFISFRLFEGENIKPTNVDFLPYFKEHNLYEERHVTELYKDLENFMVVSDKIYKANPSLYSYRCPNYKCSNNSKSEKNNKLNIKEIKRNAIHISDTKKEMINYISKFGFRNNDKIVIMRRNKKWIVWLDKDKGE